MLRWPVRPVADHGSQSRDGVSWLELYVDFMASTGQELNEGVDRRLLSNFSAQIQAFSKLVKKVTSCLQVQLPHAYRCVRTVAEFGLLQSTVSGFRNRPCFAGHDTTRRALISIVQSLHTQASASRRAGRYPGLCWPIQRQIWQAHADVALQSAIRQKACNIATGTCNGSSGLQTLRSPSRHTFASLEHCLDSSQPKRRRLSHMMNTDSSNSTAQLNSGGSSSGGSSGSSGSILANIACSTSNA